jgi:uncharacterized MAPEG superfamily protein
MFAISKQGKYDNKHPRLQQANLEGLGARAVAAQQNSFEAVCFFAPTVLLVLALNEHTVNTAQWCVAFIVCRFLYLGFYWANMDILRSLAWTAAMATLVPHYYALLN